MAINSISVRLGFEPQALSRLSALLYREDLSPESILVSLEADGYLAHIIVSDSEKLVTLLTSHNFSHEARPVLAAAIPDQPGGLHVILKILDRAAIRVNRVYPTLSQFGRGDYLILDIDDIDQARELLKENWIHLAE